MGTDRPGALAGIKVVDVTQEVAGPLAARILAEMGADVIHVEPTRGDNGRNSTTRFLGTEGLFHQVCNRSKRSLAVDLAAVEGREVVGRLLEDADVVVDGTAPGTLERMGFGYERLRTVNPRLVYAALTGYGRKGPLGDKRGYDVLVQAYSGVLAPPDEHGRHRLLGFLYADTATPLLLVNGILAALLARTTTGRGQYVETSLLQGAVHMLGPAVLAVDDDPDMQAWVTAVRASKAPGPRSAKGPQRPGDPTTQIFEAGDGQPLMLAAWTDAQFQALCRVLDLDEVGADPAFATRLARSEQGDNLRDIIGSSLLTRPAHEWLRLLDDAGIPCGAVNTNPLGLIDEDHLWESDMLVKVDHPTKGAMVQPGVGIVMGDTPMGVGRPAPFLGQHTTEILERLGYGPGEIDALRAAGVITTATPDQ